MVSFSDGIFSRLPAGIDGSAAKIGTLFIAAGVVCVCRMYVRVRVGTAVDVIMQPGSLYCADMCQMEIPALCRQPALLRISPLLVVPICAKRLHRHYVGNRHYSTGIVEGPLMYSASVLGKNNVRTNNLL